MEIREKSSMSKRKPHRQHVKTQAAQPENNASSKKMSIITLCKPEPILTTGTNYRDVWYDNEFDHFTLPIDRLALAQLSNLNSQHGGVIYARHNMVAADYQGGGLTHEQLRGGVFDYLSFGDLAIVKL